MGRNRIRLLCLLLFCLTLSPSASACSQCTAAMMWIFFPPLLLWEWLGLVWFPVLALLCWKFQIKARFVPSPKVSLFLVVCGYLLSFWLKPLTTLPFLIFSMIGTCSAFRRSYEINAKWSRWGIGLVGFVGMGMILGTTLKEVFSPTIQTPEAIIIRWPGTASARNGFRILGEFKPEDSISSYRRILREGDPFEAGKAAVQLARIGETQLDAPLILETMEKYSTERRFYLDPFSLSLAKITGIGLPAETSAQEWRAQWQAIKKKSMFDDDRITTGMDDK